METTTREGSTGTDVPLESAETAVAAGMALMKVAGKEVAAVVDEGSVEVEEWVEARTDNGSVRAI